MSLDITLIQGGEKVFEANITHNLAQMADKAGIYEAVWRPEDGSFTHAQQLVAPLTEGICLMIREPDRFRNEEPRNGWGSYDDFIPWLFHYLQACRAFPNASIIASR